MATKITGILVIEISHQWVSVRQRKREARNWRYQDITGLLSVITLSQKINSVSSIQPLSSDQPYGLFVIGLLYILPGLAWPQKNSGNNAWFSLDLCLTQLRRYLGTLEHWNMILLYYYWYITVSIISVRSSKSDSEEPSLPLTMVSVTKRLTLTDSVTHCVIFTIPGCNNRSANWTGISSSGLLVRVFPLPTVQS